MSTRLKFLYLQPVILLSLLTMQASDSFAQQQSKKAHGVCHEETLPSRVDVDFGEGSFHVALSQSAILEGSDGELYISVEFTTRKRKGKTRPPLNLALVFDRSGSMSGDKIEQARAAALGLIERLRPQDRVALIQYDNRAQVLVSSTELNPTGKARLEAAIEGLYPGGSTNLHDGLQLGFEEVFGKIDSGQVTRIILLSDGRANTGIVDPSTLAALASADAEQGVRITTVGVGVDYNEDLMEAIATNGLGNYYYVQNAFGLKQVFLGEIEDMQATVATGVELFLEPACSHVEILEVFGYAHRKDGKKMIIGIPDLAGGEKRKVVMRVKAPSKKIVDQKLLDAQLFYKNDKGTKQNSKRATVGVSVSKSQSVVSKSADKDVMAQVLQIESAVSLRKAAKAYENGDVKGASQVLREAKKNVEKQAKTYDFSDDIIEGALKGNAEMSQDIQSAKPSSKKGKHSLKRSKSLSRDAMH